MTNDSTSLTLNTDVKNKSCKSPRQSSILFIRQFARVCFNPMGSDFPAYIAN